MESAFGVKAQSAPFCKIGFFDSCSEKLFVKEEEKMANNYSNCEKKYDRQLAAAFAVYMMGDSSKYKEKTSNILMNMIKEQINTLIKESMIAKDLSLIHI